MRREKIERETKGRRFRNNRTKRTLVDYITNETQQHARVAVSRAWTAAAVEYRTCSSLAREEKRRGQAELGCEFKRIREVF